MILKNKNDKFVLVISVVITILSAYCAIRGFVDESLYSNIISTGVFKMAFMPGTTSQDIITIISTPIMLILVALYSKRKDMRLFVSVIGLLSFYFYGYGTYVFSVLYTSVYLVYMIIFMLSIFGIIVGVSGFESKDISRLSLPKWLRVSSAAFLILIVCIFVPMWITEMMPHIQAHTVPDFYAIYILDLCIVMPFFVTVIYMLLRNIKNANIWLGVALLKTITLILSVAIGEFTVSAHGMEVDKTMVAIYSVITLVSSVLFIFYCLKLKYSAESINSR